MRDRSSITFPSADHIWTLRASRFGGEPPNLEALDLCFGNLGNKFCDSSCLTELAFKNSSEHPWQRPGWQRAHVQVFSHPNQSLFGTLLFLLWTFDWQGQYSLHLNISPQGSWRITRETLISLHTILDTTDNLALELFHTLAVSAQSDRGLEIINLCKIHLKSPGFIFI